MKNLFKTSMLVIAAFLMSYSAKAALPDLAIVSTPPAMITQPQLFSYSGTQSGYIDFDENSVWDVYLHYSGSYVFYITANTGGNILENNNDNMCEFFPFGTSFGVTPPVNTDWEDWTVLLADWWANTSPTLDATHQGGATSGYIGVEFLSGSNTHYGWLNIDIDNTNQTVDLRSWGYNETPDAPVLAGAGDPFGSTVPIPFIASAVAMVLAGAGIVYRRKRKK